MDLQNNDAYHEWKGQGKRLPDPFMSLESNVASGVGLFRPWSTTDSGRLRKTPSVWGYMITADSVWCITGKHGQTSGLWCAFCGTA